MGRSFVLSELQPILFVMQNRLEMGGNRRSLRPDHAYRRELALRKCALGESRRDSRKNRVDLCEGNREIEWTKRVTARLRLGAQGKPFATQGKKPCPGVSDVVRLWPRVEMSRSFVLRELRRILHICQNRVEMQLGGSKLRGFL
jgi:hypothetical protein